MLNFILGCVVGFLGGMFLYGALVVSAESGKHDAAD
jgi:hypothetical protein